MTRSSFRRPAAAGGRHRRHGVIVNVVALAGAAVLGAAPAYASVGPAHASAAPARWGATERSIAFPVRVAGHRYHVEGYLKIPGSPSGRTLQVLLPGATANAAYWDFPYKPMQYSYVRAMNQGGYATLSLEWLGTGQSSVPPASQVTTDSDAATVHQVVQQLRSRRYGHFGKIVLVGWSLGSSISILEDSEYHDVDGVVSTGFDHDLSPKVSVFKALMHPANQDPVLAARHLPDGYITTKPGQRGVFYYLPNADPAVVAVDEATKDTSTPGQVEGSIVIVHSRAMSESVNVPVLVVTGQDDPWFINPRNDAAYYPPAAHLQIIVQPAAGHALNLQRNAPQLFRKIRAWFNQHYGPTQR